MSAQTMESQITCEMDVFTPTLCSLEHDGSMMNNVIGNKSVFGHCFFNTGILLLSFFIGLYIFYVKLQWSFTILLKVANRLVLGSIFLFFSLRHSVSNTGLTFEQIQ